MTKASRPHDEAVLELLREDPAFADEYLAAALEEVDQDGGFFTIGIDVEGRAGG